MPSFITYIVNVWIFFFLFPWSIFLDIYQSFQETKFGSSIDMCSYLIFPYILKKLFKVEIGLPC